MQAVAGPSFNKRQRSENWLEEDKIILKELVKERVHVIENKNTDSNTNSRKVAAWNDLRASFNNMAHTPRSLGQLKAQWSHIKMRAKQQKSFKRRERLRTGGGPQPDVESASGDDIAVWLPNEFDIDTNEFDSDKVNIGIYNKTDTVERMKDENKENELIEVVIIEDESENQMFEANAPVLPSPVPPSPVQPSKPIRKPAKRTKNKVSKTVSRIDSPAQKIAEIEIACRQDLHEVQMTNEKQKFINLKLKKELLRAKINYYTNK